MYCGDVASLPFRASSHPASGQVPQQLGKGGPVPPAVEGSWAPCPAHVTLVISLPSVSERQKDEQDRI